MITTTEFWIGALAGAVVVLVVAWWVWGRKAGALAACQSQARELQGEVDRLKASVAQLEQAKAALAAEKSRAESDRAASEAALFRNKTELAQLEGTVSRLQVEKASLSADLDRARYENEKLRARAAEAEAALQADLRVVPGVDEALAYRLNRAGVWTLTHLGTLPPQKVEELGGGSVDGVKIVRAARAAAGLPCDDLERIDGIGPVIARILYNACIFTFADLGALTADQLRDILGDRVRRLADEENLLAQARALAAEKG